VKLNEAQEKVEAFHRAVLAPVGSGPQWSRPRLRAELILEEALEAAAAQLVVAIRNENANYSVTAADVAQDLRRMLARLCEKAAVSAAGAPDIFIFAVDGLCDSVFVDLGTAVEMGIALEPFFDEVCRSNMTKVGGEIRHDGKNLKPASYSPPDLGSVLEREIQRTLGEVMGGKAIFAPI
jgi:predicted HAD superfamily Cof-like phosphohydrolase